MRKNSLVKKVLLTALTGVVLHSSPELKADSSLEVANISSGQVPSVAGSIFTMDNRVGTTDYFDMGWDSYWTNRVPVAQNVELKATTKIDGELLRDVRHSQTPYHIELSAINKSNPSALISTTTNRIRFTIKENLDSSVLYIANMKRFGQFNSSTQDINQVTNLVNALGGTAANLQFYMNLPGIVNLPSGVNNGYLDVSCKFTNQLAQTGSRTPITIDLSKDQVSGLEYVLLSGTNSNGSAEL